MIVSRSFPLVHSLLMGFAPHIVLDLAVMFSLSVTLVSITNQKMWGDMSFGLSLIGPRMSSVGVGCMLLQ
jgi:hypothetical protein